MDISYVYEYKIIAVTWNSIVLVLLLYPKNVLDKLKNESIDKPHYIDAINDIRKKLVECMVESKLLEASFIDNEFVKILSKSALEAMKTYKISDKAGLYAWASSRESLLGSSGRCQVFGGNISLTIIGRLQFTAGSKRR